MSPPHGSIRDRRPLARARRGQSEIALPLLALCVLVLGCAGLERVRQLPGLWRPAPGAIRGRLVIPRHADPAHLGPIVVYLEPLEGRSAARGLSHPARLVRRPGSFLPPFLVATVDQPVLFSNEDAIYHRLFSYSDVNAFDLGIVPRGEVRSVRFSTPGAVRFYCALHDQEDGTILVVPTTHFGVVDGEGEWEIGEVPPGRYRLHVASETVSVSGEAVTLVAGAAISVEIPLEVP